MNTKTENEHIPVNDHEAQRAVIDELRDEVDQMKRQDRRRRTTRRRTLSVLLVAALAAFSVVAAGQLMGVPSTIPYSGAIEGIDDGTVPFRFRLFDGDSAVWSSGNVDVEVVNGRFSYLLGSGETPLDDDVFADGELSIEVTINAGATGEFTFANRQEVGSAPYAVHASLATRADTAAAGSPLASELQSLSDRVSELESRSGLYCGRLGTTRLATFGTGSTTAAAGECRALSTCDGSSAHVCTAAEMYASHLAGVAIESEQMWILSGASSNDGTDSYRQSDCNSLSTTAGDTSGVTWHTNRIRWANCAEQHYVACCGQ